MTDREHVPTIAAAIGRVLDRPATPGLLFVECAPPPPLRAWIEGVALMSVPPDAPRRQWRLVPDARTRLRLPLSRGMRPTCLAAAIRPRDIGTPAPGVVVLVRFAPWATGALHGMNLGERWVDAGPAWRTSRTALDPLVRACTWLDGVLRRPGPDRRVIRAWQAVIRDVAVGAEPLARSLDVSSRTLRRLMRARGGCSLRTARAVERFQAALRLLRSDLELPWASAAARAGYCDQSHFNRAFARWVGMSPVRFFGEGHHHLNDVFARRVVLQQECLTITSVGGPHLRAAAPIRPLRRDRRRSPRRR